MTKAELIAELIAYLEEELRCDQDMLNKTILEANKILSSYYEGCCSTLRSLILNVQDLED